MCSAAPRQTGRTQSRRKQLEALSLRGCEGCAALSLSAGPTTSITPAVPAISEATLGWISIGFTLPLGEKAEGEETGKPLWLWAN